MIFKKHGLSVRVLDSDDNEIQEYQVEETEDNTIRCWIPSTEGRNFKIGGNVVDNLHPEHDLRTTPYLDGIAMTGLVTPTEKLKSGCITQHDRQFTGMLTAKLYEFGKRVLTDNDDHAKLDKVVSNNLNTIKLVVDWGRVGGLQPGFAFFTPPEIGPIHEKKAKKGHAGAAKLSEEISFSLAPNSVSFEVAKEIEPVTFVFCYGPESWLQARGIIPHDPEPELQGTKDRKKRERPSTPQIIDVDELETDDEIEIIKHMIPVPGPMNKRRRTSESDESDVIAILTKDEGDQGSR